MVKLYRVVRTMKRHKLATVSLIFLVVILGSTFFPYRTQLGTTDLYRLEEFTETGYQVGDRIGLFAPTTGDTVFTTEKIDLASSSIALENVTYDISKSQGNGTYHHFLTETDVDGDSGTLSLTFNTETSSPTWVNAFGLTNKYIALTSSQEDEVNDNTVVYDIRIDIPDIEISEDLNVTVYVKYIEGNGVSTSSSEIDFRSGVNGASRIANFGLASVNTTTWTKKSFSDSDFTSYIGQICTWISFFVTVDGDDTGAGTSATLSVAGIIINGQAVNFEEDFKIDGYSDAGAESNGADMNGYSDGTEDDIITVNATTNIPYIPSFSMRDYIPSTMNLNLNFTIRQRETDIHVTTIGLSGIRFINTFNVPDFSLTKHTFVNVTWTGDEPAKVYYGEAKFTTATLWLTNVTVDEYGTSWTEWTSGTWNSTADTWSQSTYPSITYENDERYFSVKIETSASTLNIFIWGYSILVYASQGNAWVGIGIVIGLVFVSLPVLSSLQNKYHRRKYRRKRYRSFFRRYRRPFRRSRYRRFRRYTRRKWRAFVPRWRRRRRY